MTDEMRERDDLNDADLRDAEDIEREVVVVRGPRTPVDRRDVLGASCPTPRTEPQSTARPNFARGRGRPGNLERLVEDRFSRGQEEDPTLHQQVHEGDFATGQAPTPRHPRPSSMGATREPAAERRREPERG
jgi:hypothetical protein